MSSLLSFTPRTPASSSVSKTQPYAASDAARLVRTTCCSWYLARLCG
jgi:hypothetical protein